MWCPACKKTLGDCKCKKKVGICREDPNDITRLRADARYGSRLTVIDGKITTVVQP